MLKNHGFKFDFDARCRTMREREREREREKWNISIDGTIDAFIYTTWNLNNVQGAEALPIHTFD